jgi:hypothetical protein
MLNLPLNNFLKLNKLLFLAGGWIFNTEAHPLDAGIIHCCSKKRHNDVALLRDFEQNINLLSLNDNLKEMMQDFIQSRNG